MLGNHYIGMVQYTCIVIFFHTIQAPLNIDPHTVMIRVYFGHWNQISKTHMGTKTVRVHILKLKTIRVQTIIKVTE